MESARIDITIAFLGALTSMSADWTGLGNVFVQAVGLRFFPYVGVIIDVATWVFPNVNIFSFAAVIGCTVVNRSATFAAFGAEVRNDNRC